ncbi:hypothetical protein H072_4097 [Dactylellina haptotyla CBS 200.50]|uniref:Uncharacterized protein n=1 Tax=Dactylellina haptotyla (strain CBS 200.50) TaxID=1284197 RepID=S8C2S3_DACHA|nr:hypothetical protein H072_4097 [Dactylellina haptotyla CBS 200.50]
MKKDTDPLNLYFDTSEDDTTGNSSIFRASLYFTEEENNRGTDKGKRPGLSPTTIPDEENQLVSNEGQPKQPGNQDTTFGTSVETCSTFVQGTSDTIHTPFDATSDEDSNEDHYHDVQTQQLMLYPAVNFEPLYVYASPKKPTQRPPSMPGAPAQKRAETVAEMLFRQDMQTYGLHVSTSTAAMSYFRRSEYHEALRATEFNFRAIQSQQRTYGDLRNHPFYHVVRENSPLLRTDPNNDLEERRGRRRRQTNYIPGLGIESDTGVRSPSDRREARAWTSLWEILCCLPLATESSPGNSWY